MPPKPRDSAMPRASAKKEDYTYVAPQPSILFEYVLNPFYGWVTEFYPRWWTPNGITLFGITCTLLASLLLLSETYVTATDATTGVPASAAFGNITDIRSPPLAQWTAHAAASEAFEAGNATQPLSKFFNAAAPQWLLILAGVLNLIYCIADNTDGKQARRLKLSSPVGEYLDHGLDCFTSLMSTFCLVVVGGGAMHSGAAYVVAIAVQTAMAHTLNYRRNIFIWGNRLVTVDEAMITFGILPVIAAAAPWLREIPLFGTGYRAAEVIWFGLLFAQVQMVGVFLGKSAKLAVDPIVWVAVANAAFFTWVAGVHEGGTAPHIVEQFRAVRAALPAAAVSPAALVLPCVTDVAAFAAALPAVALALITRVSLSYPALWVVTMACTASCVIHIPIAGKCLKGLRAPQVVLPVAAVLAAGFAFHRSPLNGAIVGFVGHAAVNLVNIATIFARAKSQKKAQ